MRNHFAAICALIASLSSLAVGQFVPDPADDTGFYFQGTMKAGSPSVTAPDTACKLARAAASAATQVQLTPAALGLPSGVEIVAISYANDVFGEWSVLQSGVGGRHHRLEMTVDPMTTSPSIYKKHRVYGWDWSSGMSTGTAYPATAGMTPVAQMTTVGPFEVTAALGASTSDDLEGLSWEMSPALPVLFTVSATSVSAIRSMGGALAGFNSCDVLWSNGPSNVMIAIPGSFWGFGNGDVLNAISVRSDGAAVIGVAAGSPCVVSGNDISNCGYPMQITANTLYSFVPQILFGSVPNPPTGFHFDGLNVWATAAQINLPQISGNPPPNSSDRRGDIRIHDPAETLQLTETIPLRRTVWGNNYVSKRSLSINELDGGVFSVVDVYTNTNFNCHIKLDQNGIFVPNGWGLFRAQGGLATFNSASWQYNTPVPFAPGTYTTDGPIAFVSNALATPGYEAIIGTVALDPAAFPHGYTLGQRQPTFNNLTIPLAGSATPHDEMFVLVTYLTAPGVPMAAYRSTYLTVRYRNKPQGWPLP